MKNPDGLSKISQQGLQRIHRALVLACIDYGPAHGLTSADLADYMETAARGMRTMASFKLKGDNLKTALRAELD